MGGPGVEGEQQPDDAHHDRRDRDHVDRLVGRIAVALAIVGEQAVHLAVGGAEGGGSGVHAGLRGGLLAGSGP